MDKKLIIDTSRLAPEGEELAGEVVAVELIEALVKSFGGTRYHLTAQVFGTELLVRGHLEQNFTLACSKCGKDFNATVKVDDFTFSYEIEAKTPEVDLTEDIRESIILSLPTYPVCAEACPGVKSQVEIPADDRWSALDKLKNKS